jgi:DNA-binding protein HU-beta
LVNRKTNTDNNRRGRNMTKAELIDKVHELASKDAKDINKKQTADVVDAVFAALSEAIKAGNRFTYPSFGTFTVKERAARDGRNPRTGDAIKIPASKTVSFKPAPKFKDALGKPAKPAKKAKEEKPAAAPAKKGKK